MVAYPAWTRDELILACDVVMVNGWRELRENDPRAADLSELLRSLPIHADKYREDARFRSIGSVSRKTTDLATIHPDYRGRRTRGSKLDAEVLADFQNSSEEMHSAAEAIRVDTDVGGLNLPINDVVFDIAFVGDVQAREGRLLTVQHFRRERDPVLRAKKIAAFLAMEGRISCEVCAFDFQAVYGEQGEGYIECHHVVPLHVSGETKTKLSDLILLCSNCHRMIHRRQQWLRIDELRAIIHRRDRRSP